MMSVVHCLCRHCHCCCRKLFTFTCTSSPPEPLGQFQPTLAVTAFLGEGDSSFSYEGPRPFPRGDNYKIAKIYKFKKSFSPESLNQFQPTLAQIIFWWWGFKFLQMKGSSFFQEEINTKLQKYIDEFSRTPGPISTNLGTNHPWLKGIQVCSNKGPALLLEEIMMK